METTTIHIPAKRSESLSDSELLALKEYRKGYSTDVACAASLGLDRNVLTRVILVGSGRPESISKIRDVINRNS